MAAHTAAIQPGLMLISRKDKKIVQKIERIYNTARFLPFIMKLFQQNLLMPCVDSVQ